MGNDVAVPITTIDDYVQEHEVTRAAVSVAAAFDCLEFSRPSFYAWRDFDASHFERRDSELIPLMRAVFWKRGPGTEHVALLPNSGTRSSSSASERSRN